MPRWSRWGQTAGRSSRLGQPLAIGPVHPQQLILRAAQVFEQVPAGHGCHVVLPDASRRAGGPGGPGKNAVRVNDIRFRVNIVHSTVNNVHSQIPHVEADMANRPQAAPGAGPRQLWFSPPDAGDSPRRALTRERVVAEALTVISTDGAAALSMRALATRLGVVPAALYRHVRSKEQLLDLVADGVLAEVDCQAEPRPHLGRAGQGARAPAAGGPGRPPRHRRAAQDPRPPRAALPHPGRGVPGTAAGSRPAPRSRPPWRSA